MLGLCEDVPAIPQTPLGGEEKEQVDHLEEVLKINGIQGLCSWTEIIGRKEESIQNSVAKRVELVEQTTEVIFGQESFVVNVNCFEMFSSLLGESVLLGG